MKQTLVQSPMRTELTLHSAYAWLQLFDEENVQLIILDSQLDSELVQAIRMQPEWAVDFDDNELVIFKRN